MMRGLGVALPPNALCLGCALLVGPWVACAAAQEPAASPAPAAVASGTSDSTPIAIVPIEESNRDQAKVSGALQVTNGTALIMNAGTVTSGTQTTNVILPHRGVLRVCASTTVKLAADSSVPAGDTPGLMMAMDHGAIEASFATGKNSDVLLTPDFRILIGAPGSADVKVRLGAQGDTCVDNGGEHAPYVLVTSVFDGGAYRVQPGQRVMFQHGSLQEVVDQEKEPCGCPPAPRPGTNDFPLAESAGLAPISPPVPAAPAKKPEAAKSTLNEPLVYQAQPAPEQAAGAPAATSASESPTAATPAPAPAAKPAKKPGFFRRIGAFFKRVFGAE